MSDAPSDRSLDDFPASTGEIYDRIAEHEPVTRQNLLERTYYSERTVDRTLDRLERAGYIRRTRRNRDLRVTLCQTDG